MDAQDNFLHMNNPLDQLSIDQLLHAQEYLLEEQQMYHTRIEELATEFKTPDAHHDRRVEILAAIGANRRLLNGSTLKLQIIMEEIHEIRTANNG